MPHPFQSARLVYRAVEEDDEDFFLKLQQDALGYANAETRLKKPIGRKLTKTFLKHVMDEALLGVVICLPAAPAVAKSADSVDGGAGAGVQPTLTPIGQVTLDGLEPEQSHHRHTDIGIDILPEYQGKGYGSEAIRWVLRWAFMAAGMHRVSIGAFEYNTGAIRLYEKLGFKKEGCIRENFWHEGRFWNDVHFGMLASEWSEMRQLQEVQC
ncbi:hypothetical protein B0A50_01319 [Salinomyces thailandicus]|uniref:N-acetyltransferase domain-containing protein n=1 Tax=Salinomyces thailandicus TaxID=706561 RepID=A0A4U0UBG6_9PEZI|nr:hypothetical protein B0A50_01319 [Salinomyces thailandica]